MYRSATTPEASRSFWFNVSRGRLCNKASTNRLLPAHHHKTHVGCRRLWFSPIDPVACIASKQTCSMVSHNNVAEVLVCIQYCKDARDVRQCNCPVRPTTACLQCVQLLQVQVFRYLLISSNRPYMSFNAIFAMALAVVLFHPVIALHAKSSRCSASCNSYSCVVTVQMRLVY